MRKLLYILPFLLLVISCERDANVDIPYTEPKLCISCYITPQDSFIRAKITRSNPVFNSSNSVSPGPVTNATVTLYGNNSSVPLVYNATTEYYEADPSLFPIFGGNEYRIVVTHPSGSVAEGTTVVPLVSPTNFQCSVTDSAYQTDPYYESGESYFNYSFSDPSGVNNYYRFMVYMINWNSFSGDSTLLRSGWDIFSDENADGTTISQSSTVYYSNYTGGGDSLLGYEVWLISGSYDYQRFHQSIYNYNGGNDPFSEPTLIYSNIEGGLGIFAGANGVKMRIPR